MGNGEWGVAADVAMAWLLSGRLALVVFVRVIAVSLRAPGPLLRLPNPKSPIPADQLIVPTSFSRLSSGTSL